MTRVEDIWPDWHAEELLGHGAYGSVWRASRTYRGYTSFCAIKIMSFPQEQSDVIELQRMGMDSSSLHTYLEDLANDVMGEIAAMEAVKGARNIVAIEDYRLIEHGRTSGSVEDDDPSGFSVGIRMELLEDVQAYYERVGGPSPEEVAHLGIDICHALESCHERDIIHRDIKPQNVFVSPFGDYKLGDFGIARSLERNTSMTLSQKGTRSYMAPEVFFGKRYGSSVDTYSLGLMLYRFLNGGRGPFLPKVPESIRPQDLARAEERRMRGDEMPPPSDADSRLAAIVLKACDPVPQNRYASARRMREDLEEWLSGHSASSDGAAIQAGAKVDAGLWLEARRREDMEAQVPDHPLEVAERALEAMPLEEPSLWEPTSYPRDLLVEAAQDTRDLKGAIRDDGKTGSGKRPQRVVLAALMALLLVLLGTGAVAISRGYGIPSQEAAVEEFFSVERVRERSDALARASVDYVSILKIEEALREDNTISITGIDRGAWESTAFVTVRGTDRSYAFKCGLERYAFGWRVVTCQGEHMVYDGDPVAYPFSYAPEETTSFGEVRHGTYGTLTDGVYISSTLGFVVNPSREFVTPDEAWDPEMRETTLTFDVEDDLSETQEFCYYFQYTVFEYDTVTGELMGGSGSYIQGAAGWAQLTVDSDGLAPGVGYDASAGWSPVPPITIGGLEWVGYESYSEERGFRTTIYETQFDGQTLELEITDHSTSELNDDIDDETKGNLTELFLACIEDYEEHE